MATRHPKELTIFLMALFMSAIITLLNAGFRDEYFTLWMKAWSLGFIVALPTVFIITPLVKKLVIRIAAIEARFQ